MRPTLMAGVASSAHESTYVLLRILIFSGFIAIISRSVHAYVFDNDTARRLEVRDGTPPFEHPSRRLPPSAARALTKRVPPLNI